MITSTYNQNLVTTLAIKYYEYSKLLLKTFQNRHIKRNYQATDQLRSKVLMFIGSVSNEQLFSYQKIAGPAGRVILFDPHVNNAFRLCHLIKALHWNNTKVESLHYRNTTIGMEFSDYRSIQPDNVTPVINIAEERNKNSEEAKTIQTLDEYCSKNNVFPDYIELVLPGKELLVLKGALQMLRQYRPKLTIVCDVQKTGKENMFAMFKLLESIDYKGFFTLDNITLPLHNFDCDVYQNPRSNFCCNTFLFE